MQNKRYDWGRFAIYALCVVVPAIAVGYSSWYAFHDSFVLSIFLLIITVGVAGVVTYFSGDATAKVRKYCNILHIVIGTVLCINLASHFVLGREVSAAKDAEAATHLEEERREKFKTAEAERQALLMKEQVKLEEAKAETEKEKAKALAQEANKLYHLRKLGVRGGPAIQQAQQAQQAPVPTESISMPSADVASIGKPAPAPAMTVKEVLASWNNWLTVWAFIDVFASVLGGLILASIWEWDRNGNGIPDHLESGRPIGFLPPPATGQPLATAKDSMGREWVMNPEGKWQELPKN